MVRKPYIRSLFPRFCVLVMGLVVAATPFVWMFLCSFKTNAEIFSAPITFLPKNPTLRNYKDLLEGRQVPFLRQYFNSVIVSGLFTGVNVFVCSAAAFAFAKYKFPLKNLLFTLVIAFVMVPQQATLVPLFLLMHKLNWLDTIFSVALPGAFNAFGVFFLRQVMLSIPDELIDAARIDGAGELKIYFRIALPLSGAGLVVLGVLSFVNSWNEFLWARIALSSTERLTATVGLASLVGMYKVEYGMLMAGASLLIIPVIILFVIGRDLFVEGILRGAVKG